MKHLLESMMDGEVANHLEEDKASGNANRRNGKTKKTVRGLNTGTFELESGRDRSGTFEPKVVPKRQLIITEQLEGHVLSMYAMEISATEISRITESIGYFGGTMPVILDIPVMLTPLIGSFVHRTDELIVMFH